MLGEHIWSVVLVQGNTLEYHEGGDTTELISAHMLGIHQTDDCRVVTMINKAGDLSIHSAEVCSNESYPIPVHEDERQWNLVFVNPIFYLNNVKLVLVGEISKINPISRNRISSLSLVDDSCELTVPCVDNTEEKISLMWLMTSESFSEDSIIMTQCQCQPRFSQVNVRVTIHDQTFDYECIPSQ